MNDIQYSLKAFMLNVVLWLPLAFFLWFYLAAVLVTPVDWLVTGVLALFFDPLFDGVARTGYMLDVGVFVELPEGRAVADIPINPMIYGYGLPLVAGLTIATPLTGLRRTLNLLAVFLVVVLVQAWGVTWEAFRSITFELGEPGAAVVAASGLKPEVIALAYQFGYLVLPAVVPVALWVVMNRPFIEGVVSYGTEPPTGAQGQ